ncbi:agamous-like MADS-box protein AGL62 [Hibiscus syriacus]|uniref:agamous-like MADS-box protein AGL62 n=1 Tax=Hibiscus syriacus TaxID=106335 RepID=UPI001920B300|nr:agamous-like MADS-box protein AGL62 [Hibiscus syriacus]
MAREGKKTKGKQKIEIKVIENMDDRLITFSKRRPGIYKKISEITTLCGADVLFICFSPAAENQSVIQNYNEVVNQLEAVKEKAKALAQVEQASGSEGNCWWEAPIDQLNPGELQEVESHYEDLLNQLYIARRKVIEAMTSSIPAHFNPSTSPPH